MSKYIITIHLNTLTALDGDEQDSLTTAIESVILDQSFHLVPEYVDIMEDKS